MTVEFTGERFVPSISGEIRHEHLHRYAFALPLVNGKDVLDVACGEGYGSALLAASARHVTGADISADVVEEARKTYARHNNLQFVHGNAAVLPFASQSFDVVVSFETIEHHDRHEEMLAECARVLRPDGLLILSSPNKKVYSDDAGYHNEFHVKELYFDELDALLKRHFRHVRYLGQRLATGSAIYPLASGTSGKVSVWADDGSETRVGMPQLQAPVYFLALATQERAPAAAAGSVLISQSDDLYAEFKKVAKWASGVHNELMAAQSGARQALASAQESLDAQRASALAELAAVQQALRVAAARAENIESQSAEQIARVRDEARLTEDTLNAQLRERAAERSRLDQQLQAVNTRLQGLEGELAAVREAADLAQREASRQAASLQQQHAERLAALSAEWAADRLAVQANHALREQTINEHHAQRWAEAQQQREEDALNARDRIEAISFERDALQETLDGHLASLAALQLGLQTAARDIALRDEQLAQAGLREQQMGEQHAAALAKAARRDEALQRELVDLQRRARSAEASASIRIVDLTRAVHAQRAQLVFLAQRAQRVLDSLWWRAAAPIRHVADSLLGGSLRADADAMRMAVAETQALDLTDPRDLERLSTASSGTLRNSFMSLANKTSPVSVTELLALDGTRFVQNAYLAVLGREPDRDGLAHYCELLAKGHEKVELLSHLRYSDEGRQKQLNVPGLDQALKALRLSQLPLVGTLFRRRLRAPAVRLDQTVARGSKATAQQSVAALQSRLDNVTAQATQQAELVCMAQALAAGRDALEYDVFGTARALLRGTDDDFMALLYRVALHREPQSHEHSHYSQLLAAGASRQHIADIVLRSAEFRALSARMGGQPLISLAIDHGHVVPALREPVTSSAAPTPLPLPAANLPMPSLPRHVEPVVSVIVPVYGKVDYTLQCLRSIAAHLPRIAFEVIVVDDCSPDDTAALVQQVEGVRLVSNVQNMGFIRSCNHGAREARGKYLCFLNNDTEVHAGWLDELVRTFDIFPGTGFAGSKLIYPDGTLQEAGGILWQDGSAWNFGRGQSPDLPQFNYAREVDYCSGASIMVPAALFAELGGFDEHYLPAYCEDSDLALKIRDRGYRVIYQPMSVVVHHEGITSGTDTGHGTKAYQVANSKKLFERWQDRLATYQPNGVNPDNAKDRRMKRRVLVLEHCTPTPDQDAGSVSVFNMLLLLREMDFQVTFIAEDNFLYMPDYTVMLQRAGIEVLYAPYVTSVVQHLQDMGGRYDLVYLFRPVVVERHIEAVRTFCPQAKVLFYTHDIHHIRMEREAALLASPQKASEAAEMKAREFKAIRAVDSTIVVSTAELEILQPQLPDQHLKLLPLMLDVPGTTSAYEQRSGIVFVGGYQHTPNVDAVVYFVTEVMPLLRPLLPGIHFHAVGSKPPQVVQDLAAHDVEITGFVEDLKPMLDRMRVSVAPLRYGAGVKGKVGTALANGLPTVVSPVAAEGMSIIDGEHVLTASSPIEFAEAIVQVYTDKVLWTRLSQHGVECAERTWGPRAAFQTFGSIVSGLGFDIAPSQRSLSMYVTELHS